MPAEQISVLATAWLSLFCITVSLFGSLYALGGAWAARGFVRRGPPAVPTRWPDISILKPLSGAEPQLYENIESFLKQDYPGRVQVIFGVQHPRDEAIPVVNLLIGRYPDLDLQLVVSGAVHGANRKVSNLLNMAPAIRHPIVVLADSDVAVPPGYLKTLAAALAAPGVGAVTCLYTGQETGGFWSRLATAATLDHFLPGVLVGMALGLAHPCVGQTIALSRETLARIGGFGIIADKLADDYALGEAVRRIGLQVVVPRMLVATTFPETSLREVVAHESRWARTIFTIDPVGHVGSGITHALPWALIGAALGGFDACGMAAIGAALASRLFLKFRLAREFGLSSPDYALTPLRDILSFVVYCGSFWSKRVSWRGRSFVVRRDGTMAEVGQAVGSTQYGKAMR